MKVEKLKRNGKLLAFGLGAVSGIGLALLVPQVFVLALKAKAAVLGEEFGVAVNDLAAAVAAENAAMTKGNV